MSAAPTDDVLPTPAVDPVSARSSAPPRTLWEEGRLPSAVVVVLACAAVGAVVGLDLLIGGRLGWILDVGFVLVCLGAALAVRPGQFFGIGVLPPLVLLGVMLLVGILDPDAIGSTTDGRAQSVVAGLALHAGALFAGYAGTLGVLLVRLRAVAMRRDRNARRASPYATTGTTPTSTEPTTTASGPHDVPDWSSLGAGPRA